MSAPPSVRPLVLALIVTLLMSAVPARGEIPPSTRPTAAEAKDLRLRIAKLNKLALSDDIAAFRAAAAELLTLGDAGKASLADALRQVLARDKARIELAAKAAGDPAQAKAAGDELAALRQQAADELARLDKPGAVKAARANHDKLNLVWAKVQPVYAGRMAVLDLLGRRDELKAMWPQCAPPGAKPPFDDLTEAQLEALADKAIGMPRAQAAVLLAAEAGEPDDPALRGLWQYRFCRQVEAYNRSLAATLLDPPEAENVRLVNAYRERLGLRPLEVDARLVQAARRHAKEMAESKYVALVSPTTGDAMQRMRTAGYTIDPSAGSVAAANSAEAAFWACFNSAADHHNLVTPRHTAVGPGRWNDKWSLTFGGGSRLMLASAADRDKAVVQGDVVPPQSQALAAARRPQRGEPHPEPNQPITPNNLPKPRLPGGDGGVPMIPGIPGLPGF